MLPNAYRNTQLAWLCNFQAAAAALDSVSLSDYMIEYGGPVIPGKKKYLPQTPGPVVDDITARLLSDKLKFQDMPMAILLLVWVLASLGAPAENQIIPLVSLGVTILSILSGYTSSRWRSDPKGVDLRLIVRAIQERLDGGPQLDDVKVENVDESQEGKDGK